MDFSIFTFILGFPTKLLKLTSVMYDFFSHTISIKGVGEFQVYGIMFGAGFIALVTLVFIKKVVPLL